MHRTKFLIYSQCQPTLSMLDAQRMFSLINVKS
jgi:hypothetical protein